MVKSYLIDGKSLRSNPQYRGTALRAISRFGESRSSYCRWSLGLLSKNETLINVGLMLNHRLRLERDMARWLEQGRFRCLACSLNPSWCRIFRKIHFLTILGHCLDVVFYNPAPLSFYDTDPILHHH